MKAPLKARAGRPSPEDALRIAGAAAPTQPPAQLPATGAAPNAATTLNLRVRRSTVDALTATARDQGLTLKQVVMHALAKAGVAVAPADMEDRTPRRR